MNVTVEHLGPCKKLVRVEIDPPAVDAAFESVTAEMARHAQLPGFRPGKAPRAVVAKAFAGRIEEEVRRRLIVDNYRKALEEQKLRPVTQSEIEEIQFGRGQALQFAATVETEPDFTLPEYRGLAVKREHRVVSEADVAQALDMLRDQRATFVDVARPVQTGDFVVINYQGTCDGKPITDLVPAAGRLTMEQNFWVHIQPGQFIPGFTEQLLGAVSGESRTVTVQFPVGFVVPELVGQTGVYAVQILQVKERLLPELSEAFAKSWGASGLEQLRAGVRRDLEQELKTTLRQQVRGQIIRLLRAQVDFEVPETVLAQATRSAVYDLVQANQDRGVKRETIEAHKDQIYGAATQGARERVKNNFLMLRIAERENIRAAEEEISQRVVQLATQNQMKPDRLLKQLQENGGLGQIAEQIVLAKTMDFLELHAQIEEVPAGTLSGPEPGA